MDTHIRLSDNFYIHNMDAAAAVGRFLYGFLTHYGVSAQLTISCPP